MQGEGQESPTGPINGYVATRTTSGSKTNTPLLETPQAVTVIGTQQIDTLKAKTVGEAVHYAPGIRGETFGNDTRNDFFLIRGFDASTRGYFLDNLQLFSTSFATFKIEPFGLERLEVLRGPSSVLYGGSNPGGLLNGVSKRPPNDPFRYVEFGVNNFGRAYGAFDFGGPVSTAGTALDGGQVLYRMVGVTGAGGTQTQFTGDDRVFLAPSITWKPNDGTKLTVYGSYTRDSTNGQNFLPYFGTVRPAPFGRIPTRLFTSDRNLDTFVRNQGFAGYELEHVFDQTFTARQNLRYGYLDINFASVYGGGYSFTDPNALANGSLARFNFLTQPRVNLFNVDNQLEARFATGPLTHTALFGLDYRRYLLNDNQAFQFGSDFNLRGGFGLPNAPLTPASRYINARFVQDQLGLYVQDQIRYDRFTLALSGRYDYVATDTNNYLAPNLSRNGEEGRFSGRAGLIYTSEIGLAPYAAYSNSFNPQVGLNGVTNRPFRSETGEQVEVGVKYQPEGSKSYIGFSAFDLRRQNVLTNSPVNALLSIQNAEVRSTGIEIEAVANVMPGLNIVGAYTVYDLENTKNLDPTIIGRLPTNTPERFGGLFADYTFQDGWLQGFGFGGGVRFVGRSFADVNNTFRVPGYVVGDALVHYDYAGLRMAVNLQNVTDETFVGSCSTPNACFYGERRKITGSVSYRW